MLIDLCCGDKKRPGALGVDWMAQSGIDVVHNLNQRPWPLEASSATDILCEHGIEHVDNVVDFMAECHRILKPGGVLRIVTPHFSSSNSYGDPTHVRHLSAHWFRPFGNGGYLAASTGKFSLVSTNVSFGRSLRAKMGQMIVRLRGLEKWEKNSAFRYPALDVQTVLRCEK
jgi:SAM-dependent methyltransferase